MTFTLQNQWFENFKEATLSHRYIALKHILPLLEKHKNYFQIKVIGYSALKKPIHLVTIGHGEKKILMWSQMHGNESTTTKAMFDLLNLFKESNHEEIKKILECCTIEIIPILNPDGAEAYTRLNANDIDLNRDAQQLSQPESKVLRSIFEDFNPNFCFNLHGQRTIFSAGNANLPATISLLAPAQDEDRKITYTRKKAMEIIVTMNSILQQQIPNQVGIYDDTFNINCVGDTFQSHNTPTILIEAGHYQNDYARDVTRRFVFQSIVTAIQYIANNDVNGNFYESYLDIPMNEKLFYDVIIRNVLFASQIRDIGIMYQERLINDKIEFVPLVEKITNLNGIYGHRELDAYKNEVVTENFKPIKEGSEIDFVLIKNERILLIPKNI